MIPDAYKNKSLNLDTGTSSLLEIGGIALSNNNVFFNNDIPVLSTSLNLGHAASSANASLAIALGQIAKHRFNSGSMEIDIDVQTSELGLAGALVSKVNNKNFVQSMFSFNDLWILYKTGILKGVPIFKINKTSDDRWFHTHPNFNCQNIQKVIGTTIIRTPEEWLAHPHGKQLFERPVVEIEKISDSDPSQLSQLPTNKNKDGVLAGLKVLDLSRVLAGPNTTQILCEYGADCLKISHPKFPYYPFFSKIENRGKRSAYLDLQLKEDRSTFFSLVEEADVIVSSYNKGGMRRLGLDEQEVAKRSNKGIVYVHISCYGSGPWENREGFDSLAQSTSGFAHLHSMTNPNVEKATKYNSENNIGAPEFIPSSVPNDYITAYLASYGALIGLLKRHEFGGSYHIKVSLTQTAMWTMRYGLRKCSFSSYDNVKQLFPVSMKFEERVMKLASKNYEINPSQYGNLETIKSPITFKDKSLKNSNLLQTPKLGTHRPRW